MPMMEDADWLTHFLEALLGLTAARAAATHALSEAAATGTAPAPSGLLMAPVLAEDPAVALLLTPTLLHRLSAHDPDLWAPILVPACTRHHIDSARRIAAFLANILVETGGLTELVESLNYTPDALLSQWPKHFTADTAQRLGRTASHPADQRGIAEAAYGGRMGNGPPGSGDGWLFRGRGLIQITGRDAYAEASRRTGIALADLPAYLEKPDGAAESAAADWESVGCNRVADTGDIDRVRTLVNGGSIGLAAVRARYALACKLLGLA